MVKESLWQRSALLICSIVETWQKYLINGLNWGYILKIGSERHNSPPDISGLLRVQRGYMS